MGIKKTLLINERGPHFWDTHSIAEETQYAQLKDGQEKILSYDEFQSEIEHLKDKKVLVYIHGLRTTQIDVLKSHYLINKHISLLEAQKFNTTEPSLFDQLKQFFVSCFDYFTRRSSLPDTPYDVVIGYTWPSFDHEVHYYNAKEHAKILAPKLSKQLAKISSVAKRTDVMAHSMGNLLLFEALSKQKAKPININHIYSVAAAIPHDSLNLSRPYHKALDFCNALFIFHSQNDSVLAWPYFLAEQGTYALGLVGPQKTNPLKKVKVINASDVIKGHSDYLKSKPFYEYLLKIHNQEIDLDKSHFQMQQSILI